MKKKRTYNTRLIRRGRSYTVQQIAALFKVHPNAVRQWIKEGLPCLKDVKPQRVHGSELAAFLDARQGSRRHTCAPTQIYCCKCRKPRSIWENIVDVIIQNAKQLRITGLCAECSTLMNRAGAVRKLDEYRKTYNVQTIRGEHLVAGGSPLVKRDL